MSHRKLVNRHFRIDFHSKFVKGSGRLLHNAGIVQKLEPFSRHPAHQVGSNVLPVQLNVARHRKTWQQHKFLVYHADPQRHGVLRGLDFHGFPLKNDLPLVTAGLLYHVHSK